MDAANHLLAITILVLFEMVAGALWDLMKLEFVRAASAHLGYPEYMGTIIGVPRVPCVLACSRRDFND